jgi:hypothetical protein
MRAHQLILRNVSQHRLSSALTLLSVALGALLLSAVLLLRRRRSAAFSGRAGGFPWWWGRPGRGWSWS